MKTQGNFTIKSDVVQQMPNMIGIDGHPYYHLATVGWGNKEYVAYASISQNMVWIEEVIASNPVRLQKIKDESLWSDLKDMLFDQKLLEIGNRKEVPISKSLATELGLQIKRKPKEI